MRGRRRVLGLGCAVALALAVLAPLGAARVLVGAEGAEPVSALVAVGADGALAVLPDGDAPTPLPVLLPGDRDVAVSPGGRRIAFSSERAGNRELYVLDVEEGRLTRLSWSSRREDVDPAWSPDGSTLVWASGRDGDHDLYLRRLDRPAARRLTAGLADDREPAWAPDGHSIVFASDRAGRFDLWRLPLGGGSPELLLDAAGDARAPAVHPAGDRIAYTGIVGLRASVWTLHVPTQRARQLTGGPGYSGRPSWSPDGRSLSFLRGREGRLRPWLARADGTGARPVPGRRPGTTELTWARLSPRVAPSRAARLPDLDQRPPADLVVRAAPGGRWVLGFTSATDNLGDGPLVLRGRRSSPRAPLLVTQGVEHRGGGVRTLHGVGVLRYEAHPPHRHWHLDDFVRYELRTADGRFVRRDRKTGFCLVDRWGIARPVAGRKPPPPRFVGDCAAGRPDVLGVVQGTSVGYTDRYPAFFHGQELELTELPAGRYQLVQRANPERRLRELDYANNASSLLFRLTWPQGRSLPPRVETLRVCGGSETCGVRPAK
jgi:hypothetical protein